MNKTGKKPIKLNLLKGEELWGCLEPVLSKTQDLLENTRAVSQSTLFAPKMAYPLKMRL